MYELIWRRFVACQMTPAEFDQTIVTVAAPTRDGDAVFRATGRKLVFDGFMKVAGVTSEDQLLPELSQGQPVAPLEIDPTQHFTQPPPRFTEASLVKAMEQLGIGRPSTYAAIIETIQNREYVEQIDRRFHATMLGMVVIDKLIQAFPDIMDVKFTAGMEGQLDEIEEQHKDWVKLLRDFYGPFHKTVEGARQDRPRRRKGQPLQVLQVRQADGLPHQQGGVLPGLQRYRVQDLSVGRQAGPAEDEAGQRHQLPGLRPRDDQAQRPIR